MRETDREWLISTLEMLIGNLERNYGYDLEVTKDRLEKIKRKGY